MASMNRSILIVGGPDAGKTNFLGRLWLALAQPGGAIGVKVPPQDVRYVEGALGHLLHGDFAPHSTRAEGRRDFDATVEVRRGLKEGAEARILLPDISGELWSTAVESREIDAEWMTLMQECDGALLFVRIMSDQLSAPLDWVASAQFLESGIDGDEQGRLPTQVFCSELLRFLEQTLRCGPDGSRPRVAVVVTAWDLLDLGRAKESPRRFLEAEFPLFAGRIADCDRFDIEVFGFSVVGGDLSADEDFKRRFHEMDPAAAGYVVLGNEDGTSNLIPDVTLPVAWVLGVAPTNRSEGGA